MMLKTSAAIATIALGLSGCGGGTSDAGEQPQTADAATRPHVWQNVSAYFSQTLWPNGAPPTIDVQPADDSVVVGASKTFTVHSTGTAPLNYQWMRSGTAIPGATSSSYTLDTASFGDDGTSFTVQVSNAAGQVASQPARLSVNSAAAPNTVAGCKEITAPGAYRLAFDVSPRNASTCISIHDTHDVQLDCAGHTVATNATTHGEALSISNVKDFSIKNCRIAVSWLNVEHALNGSFTGSTFVSSAYLVGTYAVVNIEHSSRMTFERNTLLSVAYQQAYGEGNSISRNSVTAPADIVIAANIVSNFGSGTRILGNLIDGQSAKYLSGADDGIVVQDESDAAIEDNEIHDTWDCGIEFSGSISSTSVQRNSATNTGWCGIGGWYWLSLSNVKFVDNKVDRSYSMFNFFRRYGLRAAGFDTDHTKAAETAVLFRDTVFDGNIFTNPIVMFGTVGAASNLPLLQQMQYDNQTSSIAGETVPLASQFDITNNIFRNNDFGHDRDAPWVGVYDQPHPADAMIDGGGNECKIPPLQGYPLACQ